MQIVINALDSAALYLLVALGFSLIYRVTRFFNFAHAVVFTIGAYVAFSLRDLAGCPLGISIGGAVVASALAGCAMERCVYRPLRRMGAPANVLLIASLGLYVVLQNVISLAAGDGLRFLPHAAVSQGAGFLGAAVTSSQQATIATAAVLLVLAVTGLPSLRCGKLLRAVADDPELAQVVGIGSDRVVLLAFALGSGIAGLAGVLAALEVGLTPTMGMSVFMMAAVAAIIGGMGSMLGLATGALILALARHGSAWLLASQWQDVIAFTVLLMFLWLRPNGLFQRRSWKGALG